MKDFWLNRNIGDTTEFNGIRIHRNVTEEDYGKTIATGIVKINSNNLYFHSTIEKSDISRYYKIVTYNTKEYINKFKKENNM